MQRRDCESVQVCKLHVQGPLYTFAWMVPCVLALRRRGKPGGAVACGDAANGAGQDKSTAAVQLQTALKGAVSHHSLGTKTTQGLGGNLGTGKGTEGPKAEGVFRESSCPHARMPGSAGFADRDPAPLCQTG